MAEITEKYQNVIFLIMYVLILKIKLCLSQPNNFSTRKKQSHQTVV